MSKLRRQLAADAKLPAIGREFVEGPIGFVPRHLSFETLLSPLSANGGAPRLNYERVLFGLRTFRRLRFLRKPRFGQPGRSLCLARFAYA